MLHFFLKIRYIYKIGKVDKVRKNKVEKKLALFITYIIITAAFNWGMQWTFRD